jgi:hypothetical protein
LEYQKEGFIGEKIDEGRRGIYVLSVGTHRDIAQQVCRFEKRGGLEHVSTLVGVRNMLNDSLREGAGRHPVVVRGFHGEKEAKARPWTVYLRVLTRAK